MNKKRNSKTEQKKAHHTPERNPSKSDAILSTKSSREELNSAYKPHSSIKANKHPTEFEIEDTTSLKRLWCAVREPRTSGGIISVFTVVIALATVVSGFISYFQWWAVSDANRINRESVQNIQRAFVKFDSFVVHNVDRFTQDEVVQLHQCYSQLGKQRDNSSCRYTLPFCSRSIVQSSE